MARPLGHAALQRAWPYIHGEALPRYLWGRHGGTNVRDLAELPRTQRARMSRRATAAAEPGRRDRTYDDERDTRLALRYAPPRCGDPYGGGAQHRVRRSD